MQVVNIDGIVNNMLLKRRYPKHWYLEFLLYGVECLREIGLDELEIYNTQKLPVSLEGTVELPADYIDYILVGIEVGGRVRPLVEDNSLNNLQNFDSTFQVIPFNNSTDANAQDETNLLYAPNLFSQFLTVRTNSYGENTGRFFGGSPYRDSFKIVKSRNQIQLDPSLKLANIVLIYASSGLTADGVTNVPLYAQKTIQEYIMYQFYFNNRTYGVSETEMQRQRYIDERKVLRARLSDLTISTLKRIVNRNTIAAQK